MSLKNSIERLKAAMRSSTPSKNQGDCPQITKCFADVDGKCFKYETYRKTNSAGDCLEVDRSSVKVSDSPCEFSHQPKC